MERTRQIFGRALTPQEAVAQILSDIERDGDQALLRYIARIDGQELTAEELLSVKPSSRKRSPRSARSLKQRWRRLSRMSAAITRTK